MIYDIDRSLCRKFGIFEKNKLPPRAYMIPYGDKQRLENTSIHDERYSSDVVRVLSGDWDFKYYKSEKLLPRRFNTSRVKFASLPVPGDWQRNGISEPVYMACPYEFSASFPGMPEDMPVGVYRKIISIENPAENTVISFLGAANNISLYVNSVFAGYSEGSHNTAEFNIGKLLVPGENELVAVSFKWCNGSYLESQDMFRENGIFRDVLLYEYGESFIFDFEFTYEKAARGYKPFVKVCVEGETSGREVTAEFKNTDGRVLAEKTVKAEKETLFSFDVLDVREWNAEEPEIYYLYLTLSDGDFSASVRSVVGFKRTEIDGNVFRFNGMPVKCKGVNHHDSTLRGYVMTLEEMETDVKLMKALNVNTVRTSHYPPDPYFLTLADVYGLYIVDEADIEAHGCDELLGDTKYISCSRKWIPYFVDRVKRMYYRDRNHPSLLMWSLGNESGGSLCQDKCYEFLKEQGTKIPVHFESVRWKKRFHYDVISDMYTSTEELGDMMEGRHHRDWDKGVTKRPCHEYEKYPYFLCEYCHAMGVGPGNLEEYVDIFYKWESSMGGCIWEWADHTVFHRPGDKKYKYSYTYGGDHSAKEVGEHYCCDGLVYADRRLHTGAKEMKTAYRPLRASHIKDNVFSFENTNRFRSSAYIGIKWIMLENGAEKAEGEFITDIAPMKSENVTIEIPVYDKDRDCHINFIYTDIKSGENIAVEQISLNDVPYVFEKENGSGISLTNINGSVSVSFEGGSVTFDSKSGEMTSFVSGGRELLSKTEGVPCGFVPSVYRAFSDNDIDSKNLWLDAGLDRLKRKCKYFAVYMGQSESVCIETYFDLISGRERLYHFAVNYYVAASGEVKTEAYLVSESDKAVSDIPCFGLDAFLCRDLENVEYYGRGEDENYPDFKCHAPVGIYGTTVSSAFEPYVFPQESGNHCDVKKLRLTDNDGKGLTIYACDRFAFSVHPFSQAAIDKAKHIEDLKDMGVTCLCLRGKVRGIGSSSCGPDTRKEYRLNAKDGYSFSFIMVPDKN